MAWSSRLAHGLTIPDVAAGGTAVGVLAKLTNCTGSNRPSQDMKQVIDEQGGGI
jgi:hypothetical protein